MMMNPWDLAWLPFERTRNRDARAIPRPVPMLADQRAEALAAKKVAREDRAQRKAARRAQSRRQQSERS